MARFVNPPELASGDVGQFDNRATPVSPGLVAAAGGVGDFDIGVGMATPHVVAVYVRDTAGATVSPCTIEWYRDPARGAADLIYTQAGVSWGGAVVYFDPEPWPGFLLGSDLVLDVLYGRIINNDPVTATTPNVSIVAQG